MQGKQSKSSEINVLAIHQAFLNYVEECSVNEINFWPNYVRL